MSELEKQQLTDNSGSTKTKPKRKVWGTVLLIFGILILILLLVGGSMMLAALRSLRGEEQIPIVPRESEYVMETMDETIQYIDDWSEYGGELETDETVPPETEDLSETTQETTESEQTSETTAAVHVPIYQQNQNNKDVINILLLGRDARNAAVEYGRTDTMIILSYNKKTKDVKMVSLLRDLYVPIEGHGYNRINTAYAFGGIGLCINTDIQNYVTIDFNGLVSVIDSIGGIDLNLTADEVYMYRQEGYLPESATAGTHHLNGTFALCHARNRTLGSDFERTRRQRDILTAVYQKLSSTLSLTEITNLISSTLGIVKTNLSASTLATLAADVMASKNAIEIQSARIPFANTYRGGIVKKMWVIEMDIAENIRLLHEFLYGNGVS